MLLLKYILMKIQLYANTVVKLRLSADYFDEIIPTVTNATVFLTNLSRQFYY